jgi:hypothetical protein
VFATLNPLATITSEHEREKEYCKNEDGILLLIFFASLSLSNDFLSEILLFFLLSRLLKGVQSST